MLITKINVVKASVKIFVLQFIFSFIALQCVSFADNKLTIAEEYRTQGYNEQQKGNFVDALANYTKAVTLGMQNSVVFNDMGVVCEQMDFVQKAESYYLQSVAIDPYYLPAITNLAYLYQRNGYLEKSFELFKRRYELGDPNDPWTQKAKEEILKIHPEYQDWFDFLQKKRVETETKRLNQELVHQAQMKFAQEVERANEHFLAGENLSKNNRIKEAIGEYDQALKITPNNPKFLQARKKAVYILTKEDIKKRADQAVEMLDRGDAVSARREFQGILTTIPKDSVPISK